MNFKSWIPTIFILGWFTIVTTAVVVCHKNIAAQNEIRVTTYTCNVNELYYAPLQLTVIKNKGKEAALMQYRKFGTNNNTNNTITIQCEVIKTWSYPNE